MALLDCNNCDSNLLEETLKQAQQCLSACPVVVLGSGASIPCGVPGMSELTDYLSNAIDISSLEPGDADKWAELKSTIAEVGLEQALHDALVSEDLTKQIVRATWDCISYADKALFSTIIKNRSRLALSRLFSFLFRSSNVQLQVVTTNYDRVAEYAANASGFRHYVGFSEGYLGTWDDRLAKLLYQDASRARTVPIRGVSIWKVHGSLDWFRGSDDDLFTIPGTPSIPDGLTPLIVTPGIAKYENTHYEPFRSVLASADRALMKATAFMCIGYGFNDRHIQQKLINRCYQERDRVPVLILCKHLSSAAKSFLASEHCTNYCAIESTEAGSRIYSSRYPEGSELPGVKLWSLDDFLSQAIPR